MSELIYFKSSDVGRKISCNILHDVIKDGEIYCYNGDYYILQNVVEGLKAPDLKGYKYSYSINYYGLDSSYIVHNLVFKDQVKTGEPMSSGGKEVSEFITELKPEHDGCKVTCKIFSREITDGEIYYDKPNNRFFILQNIELGMYASEMRGYDKSWSASSGSETNLRNNSVFELKIRQWPTHHPQPKVVGKITLGDEPRHKSKSKIKLLNKSKFLKVNQND